MQKKIQYVKPEENVFSLTRVKNRLLARLNRRLPAAAKWFIDRFEPLESRDVPWALPKKPTAESTVVLITTAGVHHRSQPPFDMIDRCGDPSFRRLDVSRPLTDLMITHDYYDHSDADKDINLVFPIQRLWEMEREGRIGRAAKIHYGFMGHIIDRHVQTLVNKTAPQVAAELKAGAVDIALLFPG